MSGRWIGLVLVAAATLAAAPATQPGSTMTGSTTLPAATAPAADRSSPDKTWATLCAAVNTGDVAAFRACFSSRSEVSKVFMDAYSDLTVTTFQLANATADLGDEGKKLSARLSTTYTDVVKNGENRKTEIEGDTAKWSKTVNTASGPTDQVMYFKKVRGEWLIDTAESYGLNSAAGRKNAEDFIESTAPQVKVFKEVIADIRAKKITTVQELRDRLEGK